MDGWMGWLYRTLRLLRAPYGANNNNNQTKYEGGGGWGSDAVWRLSTNSLKMEQVSISNYAAVSNS